MKLHHTAAFALLVWFLMTPPRDCRQISLDSFVITCSSLPDVPLNEWVHIKSFDSLDACKNRLKALASLSPLDFDDQCVYEGDPRLWPDYFKGQVRPRV